MPQHIIAELPPEVAQALREGRSRDAARLLLDHHPDLTLAEGKALLRQFAADNPDVLARLDEQEAATRLQWATVVVILACLALAWLLLAR